MTPGSSSLSRRRWKCILIGVTVFILLVLGAISYRWSTLERDRNSSLTRVEMNSLAIALKDCKKACGRYPTTSEGLEPLFEGHELCKAYVALGPQFHSSLIDSWRNPLTYISDGESYRLLSAGNEWIEATPNQEPTEVVRPK